MKKKFFVFSDVHGQYSALSNSLIEAGYDFRNKDHILISIGDNFDRGNESARVYDLLNQNKAICIKGNHETFLEEALEKGTDGEYVLFNCLHNGLYNTLQSFAGVTFENTINVKHIDDSIKWINSNYPKLKTWLHNLPLYYETKNYIFVHAGIDPNLRNWKDTPEDFMLWDIEHSHQRCGNVRKTVVIGHHHAFRVRQNVLSEYGYEDPLKLIHTGCTDEHAPVRISNKIAIDPCSNYTNKVNVLVIEDELLVDDEIKEETLKTSNTEFTINLDNNYYTNWDTVITNNEIGTMWR